MDSPQGAVNPRTWEGVNLLLSFSYTARGGLISLGALPQIVQFPKGLDVSKIEAL